MPPWSTELVHLKASPGPVLVPDGVGECALVDVALLVDAAAELGVLRVRVGALEVEEEGKLSVFRNNLKTGFEGLQG